MHVDTIQYKLWIKEEDKELKKTYHISQMEHKASRYNLGALWKPLELAWVYSSMVMEVTKQQLQMGLTNIDEKRRKIKKKKNYREGRPKN